LSVAGDEIRLVLPAQSRYLDVAVATMELLAARSGLDPEGVAAIRAQVYEALGERISHRSDETIVLRYEVGDGFLGVRLDGDTSYAQT
jgi:anti-sigma regulatory factor (Ser/Thr protein kinase)